MNLVFRVAYRTVFGEDLFLDLKRGEVVERVAMRWVDDGHWEVELETKGEFEYQYVYKRGEVELGEWGGWRKWAGSSKKRVTFLDDWRSAGSDERVYEAGIFRLVDGDERVIGKDGSVGNHEFSLCLARVPRGLVPCLVGNVKELGGWDYGRALPMVEVERNVWRVKVKIGVDERVEYKYGWYDAVMGRAISLEEGMENRILGERIGAGLVKVNDECFRRGEDQRFRGAGVAIPVFSLRGPKGCGVGEFADLKEMAEWASGVGLKMVQVLPVNDTTSSRTWTDSYPYSAISVYALHPLYLRVDEMSYGLVDEGAFVLERDMLNENKQVDYEGVMAVKWRVTREIFDGRREEILRDARFLDFLDKNRGWLLDYAVFCVKRDEFHTAVFSNWGEWARYSREKVEEMAGDPDALYFVWLQYELDRQLTDAVARMHELGVALKGDLPIGMDRESVEAWVSPHLFRMDTQTGAPPDAFAVKGQNWGFPTYDWEAMRRDGYAWWRSRFGRLSRYFDAYRIDHILGFFRIWQIPAGQVDGILGRFSPALGIKAEEFAQRGVKFDAQRFCRPFVAEEDLVELFDERVEEVKKGFLKSVGECGWTLRDGLVTQRDVLEVLEKMDAEALKEGLMEMVGDVLFLEEEGGLLHPRIGLMGTKSFAALGEQEQRALRELHDDYFHVRQERFWEAKAYEKLPAMRAASDMLLCGEDLGMVPACVPGVMARLGMLSLEIQRWPKVGGRDFTDVSAVPYQSVVTTGTHDMTTLRGWWREDKRVTITYSRQMLREEAQDELSAENTRRIVEMHMRSPGMWTVFPLQDLVGMDEDLRSTDIDGERINVPAITPFYWRWRMEMTIRELAGAEDFGKMLREMVLGNGR